MKKSYAPTGESCSFWSDSKRLLALLTGILVMFFCPVQNSWAVEHVITVYFGGTGLPENAWRPEINNYGNPSLIATLHRNQDVSDILHHKIYVAGVGAPETSPGVPPHHCDNPGDLRGDAFNQQKKPHKPICRTWKYTIKEALINFDDIAGDILLNRDDGDTMTLNVVGHSRGAVAAMAFLT